MALIARSDSEVSVNRRSGMKRNSIVRRVAVATIVGLVLHLLIYTQAKDDSDPPVCYSLIGYVVPCGNLSYAAASIGASFVAVLLLRGTAPRPDPSDEAGERTADTYT